MAGKATTVTEDALWDCWVRGSAGRALHCKENMKRPMNLKKQWLFLVVLTTFSASLWVGRPAAFPQASGEPLAEATQCAEARDAAEKLTDKYGANLAVGRGWFDAAHFCSQRFRGEMKILYGELTQRCDRAYADRDGTMYFAFHGLCYFKASEYVGWLIVE